MTTLERARHYVAKMPVSVSGQGGHHAAFAVACALTRGFALGEADALPLMVDWNSGCLPSWNESELRHKLRSASIEATKPLGYLLANDPQLHQAPAENDEKRKARQRTEWPVFTPLNKTEIETVARLRAVPVEAVKNLNGNGFLSAARVDGHQCFTTREGHFAQVRRFDGRPLLLKDGTVTKAKNLPGSHGAFIGRKWLGGPSVRVLLVEGVIGMLEAVAAWHLIGSPITDGWAVLAATSASSRFSRDPELLAQLAGRRVRIVPDSDEAGLEAAASWLADLERVGAFVDALALPTGIKDLGPLVARPDHHHETLTALFQ